MTAREEVKRKIDTCYNFDMEIGCVQDICICEQEEFGTKEFNDLANQYCGGKPKQEIHLEDIFNDEKKQGLKDFIDNHKQETLEEAGVAYAKTVNQNHTSHMLGFHNGAKWQQERSYSEEDMRVAHQMGAIFAYGKKEVTKEDRVKHFEEWFKQFKNK